MSKHHSDYRLMIAISVIVVFGLIMLSSASSPEAFQKFGDSYYYVKHQIIFGLLPGVIAFYFLSRLDYRRWKQYAFFMLISSIILLVLVFIPGLRTKYGTAKSWIYIFGFSFQPSELVKLTFLIYLASWLEKRTEKKIRDLYSGFIPFITVLGAIIFLMVLQPDIGTMSIIVLIAFIVYFIAGAPLKHLITLGAGLVAVLALLIKIAPYRAARFTTFLHPELDPKGIGYHINQALLAIGSGGFFGLGLGQSRQKFQYLPEVAGDSIFAIIAEELGFLFGLLLIVVFIFLAYEGLRVSEYAPDNFGKYLGVGIVSWFVLQAFINIGAMIGILPMTGIPLPFISYGGTALFTSLAASGILVNIAKSAKV